MVESSENRWKQAGLARMKLTLNSDHYPFPEDELNNYVAKL